MIVKYSIKVISNDDDYREFSDKNYFVTQTYKMFVRSVVKKEFY